MKVRKVKQRKAVCLCGSDDLRPIYLQVYGRNADILTRDFDRRYKWICRNCESEFYIKPMEQEHWDEEFLHSPSVRKESTE